MRVLKFGGAALQDGRAIQKATSIVDQYGGERPLVVVSAHAGVTGHLKQALQAGDALRSHWDAIRVRHRTLLHQLGLPQEMLDRHLAELLVVLESLGSDSRSERRLRDHVLSFGERMSARVFAAALNAKGMPAVPMDAYDLGMVSASGRLCSPQSASASLGARIRGTRGIPVITGFLALDGEGFLTTLGSSGSDLTAAWIGAALGAESIELWKHVSGLMRADPRLIPAAEHLDRLDWSEAAELARHGAVALHAGAVEPAQQAGIPIHLRSMDHPQGPGTLISERSGMGSAPGPLALAQRTGMVHVRVPLGSARPHGIQLAEFFGALSAMGLEPYLGGLGEGELQVLVSAGPELEHLKRELPEGAEIQAGLGTIAVIGRALAQHEPLARTLAECVAGGALEIHSWASAQASLLDVRGRADVESRVLMLPEEGLSKRLEQLYASFFCAAPASGPDPMI